MRATLEAIAFQMRDVLDAMRATRASALELRVDGGAAANDLLLRLPRRRPRRRGRAPETVETTALGAALVAGAALRGWGREEVAARAAPIEKTFRPRMGATERARRHAAWLEAVARVRSRPPAPSRRRTPARRS